MAAGTQVEAGNAGTLGVHVVACVARTGHLLLPPSWVRLSDDRGDAGIDDGVPCRIVASGPDVVRVLVRNTDAAGCG